MLRPWSAAFPSDAHKDVVVDAAHNTGLAKKAAKLSPFGAFTGLSSIRNENVDMADQRASGLAVCSAARLAAGMSRLRLGFARCKTSQLAPQLQHVA